MAAADKKHRDGKGYMLTLIAGGMMLAFFGVYMSPVYQTDTYAKWFYPIESYQYHCGNQARYMELLYVKLSWLITGNPVHYRVFHVFFAILINTLIVMALWYLFYRKLNLKRKGILENLLLLFLVLSMRANVFYTDIFQYGYDAAVTFLGDGLAIIAAVIIAEKKSIKMFLSACIILMISVSFRQTCFFWFVIISMALYYLDYMENWKTYCLVGELVKRVACYGIAALFVLACFRFLVHEGVRGKSVVDAGTIVSSLTDTVKRLLLNCLETMPDYYYSVLLVVGLLGLLILLLFKKTSLGEKTASVLAAILTLSGVFMAIFVPVIMDPGLPHRVVSGFGALLPLVYLLAFAELMEYDGLTGTIVCTRNIIAVLFILMSTYLLISWYCTIKLYRGQVITNTVDQQNALFYCAEIEKYENDSGITIENVAYAEDNNYTRVIPGVSATKSINERAYSTPWGRRDIIPFASGRRFEIVEFDEAVYNEFFKGKNWDTISEAQVKCVGNTAYIVLY